MKADRGRENIFRNLELFDKLERQDYAPIIIGIIFTILFHALLFLLMPYLNILTPAVPKKDLQELKIDILPPIIEKPKFPEYIEANPLGNQMQPDNADKESFQNQRAADELPDSMSKSKVPYVEGENKDYNKIVSGNAQESSPGAAQEVMKTLERPLEQPAPIVPQETSAAQKPQAAAQVSQQAGQQASAQNSDGSADSSKEAQKSTSIEVKEKDLKGAVVHEESPETSAPKMDDENGDTYLKTEKTSETEKSPKDSSTSKTKAAAAARAESKKAQAETKKPEAPKAEQVAEAQPLPPPKPRPTLNMRTPAGPLMDNRMRASEQGTLAVDSKFSEFGAYQQRMIEAISRQWNLLGSQYDLTGTYGTQVVIEYLINTNGELTHIQVLFSNASATGRNLCEQAILTTAPYGVWTEDMVKAFGHQDQSVRITFFYR